jgi:KUP system potassium uptake protein
MQNPDVPHAIGLAYERGLQIDMSDVTYFLGRETIIVTKKEGMALWRERLFAVMSKNAVRATAFFRLPMEQVVELGVQVEI